MISITIISFRLQIPVFVILNKRAIFFIITELDYFHQLSILIVSLPLPFHIVGLIGTG